MNTTTSPHPGRLRALRALLPAAALLALALAAPAAASTKIAIAPVKGDRGGKLGRQLASALCPGHKCVRGALSGGGNKLQRARKMGVEASIFASVRRHRGGSEELSVSVFTTGRSPTQTWQLPLGRNGLVPRNRLDGLTDDLDALLGGSSSARYASAAPARSSAASTAYGARAAPAAPAPASTYGSAPASAYGSAPEPAYEAPASSGYEPAPRSGYDATPRTAAGESGRANLQARAMPADDPGSVEVVVPRGRSRSASTTHPWDEPEARSGGGADGLPPFLVADVGIEGGRRALQFPANGTAPVGYVVDLAAPRIRLESHPMREGDIAPKFGFFAEGAYLPTLGLSSSARTFRVSYLSLRGGAMWRYQTEGGFVIRPSLGLELEQIAVRAANGSRFPGLPDTTLSGVSLGLDLAMPLGETRFTLLADGRGIAWLSAKELVGGSQFFPGGRAMGVELEVGVGFRLSQALSLRALGTWSATRWWLTADPSKAYTVHDALSSAIGARGWLRYAF